MTTESWLRILAAGAAVPVGRSGSRPALAVSGLLAGFAVFGGGPSTFPGPALSALGVGGVLLVALAVLLPRWLPITGDGVFAGALFGLPASVVAGVAIRGNGALAALAAFAVALAAFSLFSAEAVRASAEAGGRKAALLAWAVAAPAALSAAAAAFARPDPRGAAPALLAGGLALVPLAWLPALLVERSRVRRELDEEVRLGLLPAEDAASLELPWRRAFEKRFGRPDERREYVRSALLLAVARAQQRGRSGEAERLRQLEVLTFRTRLRRTLEARSVRHARSESGEYPAAASER